MTSEWMCPICEVGIQASDFDTLAWGIREHRASHGSTFALESQLVADGVSLVDRLAAVLLVGLYGRPFFLVRADGSRMVVS